MPSLKHLVIKAFEKSRSCQVMHAENTFIAPNKEEIIGKAYLTIRSSFEVS